MTPRLIALALLLTAAPAFAQSGAQVPEASAGMLFALGVLGVIVGRNAANRIRRHEDD